MKVQQERTQSIPKEVVLMSENVSKTVVMLVLAFWFFLLIRLLVRTLRNKFAPVKTVKAVVVGKHKEESFSKYSGNGKTEKYVILFSADGKKLSFYVSEFSYGGYRINEAGTLKYQGDKLINFS